MDKRKVESFKQRYDVIVRADSGTQIEYWYARELMPLLGYERWENFKQAIQRAIESCNTAGIATQNHFREVTKMGICNILFGIQCSFIFQVFSFSLILLRFVRLA